MNLFVYTILHTRQVKYFIKCVKFHKYTILIYSIKNINSNKRVMKKKIILLLIKPVYTRIASINLNVKKNPIQVC